MDALSRNIQARIEQLSANFPIIVILGVRQCGKSTLAKSVGPDWKYYDLENPNHLERIQGDPLLFFRENSQHVIIDEAQNTTPVQMKMVLTRLGQDSHMVITGDLSQIDLPDGQPSGLAEAVRILENIRGVGILHLSGEDVIRHPVVARILQAYEAGQKPQNKNK